MVTMKSRKGIQGMHPEADLNYSFPSEKDTRIPEEAYLPKDVFLTYHLGIDLQPEPTPACITKVPISKKFSHDEEVSRLRDPIDTILAESRKDIEDYQFTLPYEEPPNPLRDLNEFRESTITRGKKRAWEPTEAPGQPVLENSELQKPLPYVKGFAKVDSKENEENDEDLLESIPLQSTPVASPKPSLSHQTSETTTPDRHRLLRLDLAKHQFIKDYGVEGRGVLERKPRKREKETHDNLACHAGNILKMAVDSTMLGSSFSDSFSTVTNILGGNDSVLSSSQKFQIFEDPDESDMSVLGANRSKPKLNKRKAKKVEVSAKDLQAAVQSDERFPNAY